MNPGSIFEEIDRALPTIRPITRPMIVPVRETRSVILMPAQNMGQYFPAIWTADASIFKQPYLFYGLFENRIIAGLFADSRRMQGKK